MALRFRPRLKILFLWAALAALLLVAAAALAGWLALRASLPPLDGDSPLPGLAADVAVERDANGIPTIRAANKGDLFRAQGFLHAQDRFFQMDLLRRQAAGELAELFGEKALPSDRDKRRHRFRFRAAATVARLDPGQRHWLDAYTEGVNAGLAALGARPWEYLVLRQQPRPWTPEDTFLVIDAMTLSLQKSDAADERTREAIADVYSPEALAFLWPAVMERTAALDGSSQPAPPVPDAAQMHPPSASPASASLPPLDPDPPLPGSNSFALAGARTASGAALIANDMHLDLAVPAVWYRAALALPARPAAAGVTLPGVPGLVAGSNGFVAWAFTNSYADAADAVIVETDPANHARYRVPGGGWEAIAIAKETLLAAGRAPETLEVPSTRWGPLLPGAHAGASPLALHWIAYEPDAFNLHMLDLLDARSVDDALFNARRTGIPAQNFLVGDRAGHIAWTISGALPRRVGFDGSRPESWADGSRRWEGFLPPGEIPELRDPPDGQLWTANNRILGGDALARLGGGDYADPMRAAQIRDRLSALKDRPAAPADFLAIQLDDESRCLHPWRDLLLATLTDAATASDPPLAELRRLARDWSGHATIAEPGHRLVKEFRRTVIAAVMDPIYAPVRAREPLAYYGFSVEQPVWAILRSRPAHLLPAGAASWDALLFCAARQAATLGTRLPGKPPLRACTWGGANVLRMRHPFSGLLPGWAMGALNLPAQPLPGDANLPRVQGPAFGASERFDVSPGHEAEGIFHQPGGASGHFLSAFYRAGHDDWAAGRPTPFLPGAARWRLTLQPAAKK